uniref:Cytochrome c oxidase subunit 2 n=1 Tax=Valvata piscinalis TaxID=699199 RepID=A0A7D6W3F3_9GAST|nr:cytochrome c oxidase subunit II [Valvata piscinalis]QNV11782.1 cytochrome c oxidase subunit II [Valvata piscinalis]
MSLWGQLSFNNAAAPLMQELIKFHDHAMVIMSMILSFVAFISIMFIFNKFSTRYMVEAQRLEMIWTVVPAIILLFLALPSLRLLYLLDETNDASVTLKATGHQWYWSYEMFDLLPVEFDSYMTATSDLETGEYRLLDVDNRIVLPFETDIRTLVTSADVIHSWAIPSLGVKLDAIPGRLNSISMFINKSGIYYGQCSEICGANHSFMPIVIEAVSVNDFLKWMKNF